MVVRGGTVACMYPRALVVHVRGARVRAAGAERRPRVPRPAGPAARRA